MRIDVVAEARLALSQRVSSPWWYQPVMSGLLAQHVLVQGASNRNWTLPSGILLLGGASLAWLLWRRQMGVTIGAWTGRRSLLALGAWSLLSLVSVRSAAAMSDPVPIAAMAGVAFVGSWLIGLCYEASLGHDLRNPGGSGR